jgi:hypothetical protein
MTLILLDKDTVDLISNIGMYLVDYPKDSYTIIIDSSNMDEEDKDIIEGLADDLRDAANIVVSDNKADINKLVTELCKKNV